MPKRKRAARGSTPLFTAKGELVQQCTFHPAGNRRQTITICVGKRCRVKWDMADGSSGYDDADVLEIRVPKRSDGGNSEGKDTKKAQHAYTHGGEQEALSVDRHTIWVKFLWRERGHQPVWSVASCIQQGVPAKGGSGQRESEDGDDSPEDANARKHTAVSSESEEFDHASKVILPGAFISQPLRLSHTKFFPDVPSSWTKRQRLDLQGIIAQKDARLKEKDARIKELQQTVKGLQSELLRREQEHLAP